MVRRFRNVQIASVETRDNSTFVASEILREMEIQTISNLR
jgi:hypothetical protein